MRERSDIHAFVAYIIHDLTINKWGWAADTLRTYLSSKQINKHSSNWVYAWFLFSKAQDAIPKPASPTK